VTSSWEALRRRNARRAGRALRDLPRIFPWHDRALEALRDVLAVRGPARSSLLEGPGFRGWLASAEEALDLLETPADDTALFSRLARGPHLGLVAPRGRLDAGFRLRVARLARSLIDPLARRLVPLLMFRAPAGRARGPFPLPWGADGDEARRSGELHAEWPRPLAAGIRKGARAQMDGGTVRLCPGGRPAWHPRPLLPGSGIVLARRVVSTPRGLRPAGEDTRLLAPLGSALELLEEAWPEARRLVERYTRVVVPLRERNTVSFSMPSRPAVSYINMIGKSRVDLADDLLHESAHHLLHLLEESGPLVTTAAEGTGEFLYPSAWRRAPRPVRGILHATWTFSHRAGLLARLLRQRGGSGAPRSWIRRELAFERHAIARSLEDLRDAASRGLLTRRGRELCSAMEKFPAAL
jgi:HEXXH motif-containing protein